MKYSCSKIRNFHVKIGINKDVTSFIDITALLNFQVPQESEQFSHNFLQFGMKSESELWITVRIMVQCFPCTLIKYVILCPRSNDIKVCQCLHVAGASQRHIYQRILSRKRDSGQVYLITRRAVSGEKRIAGERGASE